MKRIYIAGSYSADNLLTGLDNIRNGIHAGLKLLQAGLSPFVPWLDFQFQLMLQDNESLAVEDYQRYSMDWLEVSEAVLVLPGWENSAGTKAEIARASELLIPIYYSFETLRNDIELFAV